LSGAESSDGSKPQADLLSTSIDAIARAQGVEHAALATQAISIKDSVAALADSIHDHGRATTHTARIKRGGRVTACTVSSNGITALPLGIQVLQRTALAIRSPSLTITARGCSGRRLEAEITCPALLALTCIGCSATSTCTMAAAFIIPKALLAVSTVVAALRQLLCRWPLHACVLLALSTVHVAAFTVCHGHAHRGARTLAATCCCAIAPLAQLNEQHAASPRVARLLRCRLL
jgi:hypothetical protein